MIVRPLWTTDAIRNTFGYGGGFLTAIFPKVPAVRQLVHL
jgi:hypothetical protein